MEEVARLLARGGRILGLAAVAHAGEGPSAIGAWRVLSQETADAADGIIQVLAGPVSGKAMAVAIGAAMDSAPATSPPTWAEPVWRDPCLIDLIGERAAAAAVLRMVPKGAEKRAAGIAALAMAVCRSMDSARALASKLPPEDGEPLVRLARLAGCIAEPGEPSRMKTLIKEALEVGGG